MTPAAAEGGVALAPAWQLWIATQILEGGSVDEAAAALVEAGVDAARARAEVAVIASQAAALAGRTSALAGRLHRHGRPLARRVDVRPGLDVDTLFQVYVAHGVPVLVPGFCADWPAITRWSRDGLRAAVGDAIVSVVRDADVARRDREFQRHTTQMTMSRYIDLVEDGPPGNDRYMLANHHNARDGLAPLLDDIAAPEGLLGPSWRTNGGVSLWYGPAGTHTPTHHDTTNVVFCQVRGRKRFWLAPPEEPRLAAGRDGFYSPVALSDPGVREGEGALSGGCVLQVDVGPGDMLLIPAGWWHEVLALEVSFSAGLVGLAIPNRFPWFRPGFTPGAP